MFNLPARGTANDALGYVIGISNNDGSTNVGTIRHTNNTTTDPATDYYADGVHFKEDLSVSAAHRDFGLGLSSVPYIPEPTTGALMVLGAAALSLGRRRS